MGARIWTKFGSLIQNNMQITASLHLQMSSIIRVEGIYDIQYAVRAILALLGGGRETTHDGPCAEKVAIRRCDSRTERYTGKMSIGKVLRLRRWR